MIRGVQHVGEKLRSPSFDGQFVRSFLNSKVDRTGTIDKQAELRRLTPTDKTGGDKSSQSWMRNAGGSRSFRLVSTPPQGGFETQKSPAEPHTHSVDSTPNFPRRQKSFDQQSSANRYELKQANIASIAGSPRIWSKSSQNDGGKVESNGRQQPVWTTMMKSHDSGLLRYAFNA